MKVWLVSEWDESAYRYDVVAVFLDKELAQKFEMEKDDIRMMDEYEVTEELKALEAK